MLSQWNQMKLHSFLSIFSPLSQFMNWVWHLNLITSNAFVVCVCAMRLNRLYVSDRHNTALSVPPLQWSVINTYLQWCTLAIRLRISFPISLNNISVSSYQQRDGSQELKPWPSALSQLIVHLSLQYQDIFSSPSLDWFNLYRSLLHAFSIIEPIHCVQCSPELKALHLSNNQLNPGFELIKIQISH